MTRFSYNLCLIMFVLILSAAALAVPGPAYAQDEAPAVTAALSGQLTIEDLQALNDNKAAIFIHDGRVTFVDGTCTADPVKSVEDAEKVVASMFGLLGGNSGTQFDYWRTLTDASGNKYYVFQQMYSNVSVLGGAVKVITNADGNMIGFTSSVGTELPDIEASEGITVEEAEQAVLRYAAEMNQPEPTILEGKSSKMILPVFLSMDDIVEADEADYSRFVWVVYTNNYENTASSSSELPYLAHYVTMEGEYLYSLETIYPGDMAGGSGFDAAYMFEFMEPADYTGYVDLSDGTEMELTVTLMRDKRTGMYYLGNIERKIVVADCYEFLYNDGHLVVDYSPDNLEWDQVGLLALYNMCKAYDYYREIGWIGGDGNGTPILILNDLVDENRIRIDNAAFMGNYLGWSIFGFSLENDFAQALDVITHEFTHCVTHSVMTYNSYKNDYGAINEAMSDIQGQINDLMDGNTDDASWEIADNTASVIRIMGDPNLRNQPAYTWDLYYTPPVRKPTHINDNGGVHTNSSLMNLIAYSLVNDGGMSLTEARAFWFAVDCTMVPGTDYAQLSELLPWILKVQGMEQYEETLDQAIAAVRLGTDAMPEVFDANRALVTLTLPDNENFNDDNWSMQIISLDLKGAVNEVEKILEDMSNRDFSSYPQEIRDIFMKLTEETAEPTPEPEEKGFWGILLDLLLNNDDQSSKETEVQLSDEETDILVRWTQKKITELIYMGMGAAGPDGQTIRMVTRPGRTVPILLHLSFKNNSQLPDQEVLAIYVIGKWYVIKGIDLFGGKEYSKEELAEMNKDNHIVEDLVTNLLNNLGNIHSFDDFLDLFTLNIPSGGILEISSAGLEDVVLPEPSADQPDDAVPAELPEPGKKSRPKL